MSHPRSSRSENPSSSVSQSYGIGAVVELSLRLVAVAVDVGRAGVAGVERVAVVQHLQQIGVLVVVGVPVVGIGAHRGLHEVRGAVSVGVGRVGITGIVGAGREEVLDPVGPAVGVVVLGDVARAVTIGVGGARVEPDGLLDAVGHAVGIDVVAAGEADQRDEGEGEARPVSMEELLHTSPPGGGGRYPSPPLGGSNGSLGSVPFVTSSPSPRPSPSVSQLFGSVP